MTESQGVGRTVNGFEFDGISLFLSILRFHIFFFFFNVTIFGGHASNEVKSYLIYVEDT
jgi:hypothetical protein